MAKNVRKEPTKGRSKFAKGSNGLAKFGEGTSLLDPSAWGWDYKENVVDRKADDEYLKKIKRSRGSVKRLGINDPMTRAAIEYRTQLAVGTTVRIKPTPMYRQLRWDEGDDRVFRRQVRDLWKMLMESDERWIDSAGLHTVSELAAQHTRIYETEGEAMAEVNELGASRRSPLSFNISNINPARVRNPKDFSAEDLRDRRIADGKLVSRRGYPLGFYVHDYDNKQGNFTGSENYRFVPTRDSDTGRERFIHSYVQSTSDLSRGISRLASCLTLSCQKSKYLDAALEDAIAKAGLTFLIKSNASDIGEIMDILGDSDIVEDEGALAAYMDASNKWHKAQGTKKNGNKALRLLHGEDVEGFSAQQAGGATWEQFNETIDNVAAACHGLPLEEYRQRWDRTNYSGARSGKIYVYKMIQALRAQAPWRFVRKIYCLFLEDMILQGRLVLPGFGSDAIGAWRFFLANKEAITCVDFFGAPKDEIDRAKTADGYLAEGQLGVGTWESYCEEVHGEYWEDRVDQIIDEVKTTYEKITLACGTPPEWSVADMVSHRLFAGNAFMARKDLRASGALDPVPDDTPVQTQET